jgi:2'-5' RNA ligase
MPETTPAQTFRLFIALALPEAVKPGMERAQADLRQALPEGGARWTKRDQFHLTLKFLGEMDAQRCEALANAVRGACQGFAALELRAEGIGFFPDLRRPRVIWAGVSDPQGQLPRLQHAVEAAARDFTAEASSERFTGHITLGRIKAIRRAEAEGLAKLAAGLAARFFGAWTADKVEIIRSQLAPDGAHYTTLATVPLATGQQLWRD